MGPRRGPNLLPLPTKAPARVNRKKKVDEQWPNEHVYAEEAKIKIDEFEIQELIRFLKKAKNSKSPGPDGIPMEFYKWLNGQVLEVILDIVNKIWQEEWFLENMEEANVVTLYKKRKRRRSFKL